MATISRRAQSRSERGPRGALRLPGRISAIGVRASGPPVASAISVASQSVAGHSGGRIEVYSPAWKERAATR